MTRQRAVVVAVAVAAGAAVMALMITVPMIIVELRPSGTRAAGEWRFSHVVPSARWPVTQRILDETHEYTIVTDHSGSTCTVAVSQQAPSVDPAARTRPVRVGLRPGTYADNPGESPEIVWSYADGGTAEVRCVDDVSEETLLDLAQQVEFTDSRVRLPFMITSLPAGYHVASISERRAGAEVRVTLTPDPALELPSVIVSYGSDQPSDRCIATTAYPVCLTASWSAEELPSATSRETQALAEVADRLQVVANPDDRSTWFDAIDLPDR